jgi:hypothetical protein
MSASFARALLDPWATVPGLRTWNGSDPSVRLDVYRNNVVSSLVEALADTFPVVHAVVGDAAFRTLAASHVRAHPPRSPVLAHYGGGFAAWLADAEALAAQPWLPDLARLEFARVQAYHAAEADALSAGALASWLARPDALPGLVLHLHPSVQVLASPWAVVSLWAAHQGPGPAAPPPMDQAEAALVMRAGDDAVVVPVAPATARWVARLRQGRPLGLAVTDAAEAGDTLDLSASLGLLLRLGALTGATSTTGDPNT